ncbi:hypothetical protein B0A48_04185 [Cryoendolithus antarcticus]|uniref:Uncharacterized protein n=1 Tax=Cryoendolithus antarcticus TaxID=1507870 RepID=A0A1V8THX2_9PEZI|nr:hypothetical protein B0A48_04185 [Cryoendolithus antarcticus]
MFAPLITRVHVSQYLFCFNQLENAEDPGDTRLPAAARRFCRHITRGDTDIRNALPFIRYHATPVAPLNAGLPWPDQPVLSDMLDLFTFANLSDPMISTTLRVLMTLRTEVQVADASIFPKLDELA